jgi:hypothetical protein
MSNESKNEYLSKIKPRYLKASKLKKENILDEFCTISIRIPNSKIQIIDSVSGLPYLISHISHLESRIPYLISHIKIYFYLHPTFVIFSGPRLKSTAPF